MIEIAIVTDLNEKIRMILYQTEMERVKFVIRSYLRVRLYKVRDLVMHICRL